VEWKGVLVAAKRNGTDCEDTAAIDNERSLYEKLMANPHDHVLPVYGICTDAPDGKVRLVMKLCEKGSLDALLRHHAAPEVGARLFSSSPFLFCLRVCLRGVFPMVVVVVCVCVCVCVCVLFFPCVGACMHINCRA
jgi:hypothetical protein